MVVDMSQQSKRKHNLAAVRDAASHDTPSPTEAKRCPRCGDFDISAVDHEVHACESGRALWTRFFCEWCDNTWVEMTPINEVKDGRK